MVNRKTIEFHESKSPITVPVTKFGGQPIWLEESQWPISKRHNLPMTFICQIALDEEVFPGCKDKMAYIFSTNDDSETWEPDGGENAVIIQPGGAPQVQVKNITSGPFLQNYEEIAGSYEPVDVELSVILVPSKDPDYISKAKQESMTETEFARYVKALEGNKIGGTPHFLQWDEFPEDDANNWKLLMQLDSCGVPFYVNFGDAGISYAFINKEGTVGKFLWQCS